MKNPSSGLLSGSLPRTFRRAPPPAWFTELVAVGTSWSKVNGNLSKVSLLMHEAKVLPPSTRPSTSMCRRPALKVAATYTLGFGLPTVATAGMAARCARRDAAMDGDVAAGGCGVASLPESWKDSGWSSFLERRK